MYGCAQKPKNFKYDRTWKSTGAKEGENYLIFSLERKFDHRQKTRKLRMNDIRQMKVGLLIGQWSAYGFSDYQKLCLAENGNRRQCGKTAPF